MSGASSTCMSARRCDCSRAAIPSAASIPAWCIVPRDRYDTRVAARIETVLRDALRAAGRGDAGTDIGIHAGASARGGASGAGLPPRVDLAKIERALAQAASTWAAGLREP